MRIGKTDKEEDRSAAVSLNGDVKEGKMYGYGGINENSRGILR